MGKDGIRAAMQMGIRSRSCLAGIGALMLATALGATAQMPSHDEERARDRDICGYRLMTERERAEYRERMHAARTDEDRARIWDEHREQMKARARERGFALSCEKTNEPKAASLGGTSKTAASDGSWTEVSDSSLHSQQRSSRSME